MTQQTITQTKTQQKLECRSGRAKAHTPRAQPPVGRRETPHDARARQMCTRTSGDRCPDA